MLVLSRKVGDSIQIGDDVTVTVLNFNGNHIRIGIAAPQAVPVHRREVYLRNKESVEGRPPARDDTANGSS